MEKIKLLYGYQGVPSKEKYIPPGEYKRNARALCGLADYLVSNGHAIRIPEEIEPVEVEAEPKPKPKTRRRRKKAE